MAGSPMKAPSQRRRRNKVAGAAKLREADPDVKIPKLPAKRRDGGTWHKDTKARWKAIHTSPMASEFTESDYFGLLDLAHLWDGIHTAATVNETIKASSEIRLMEQRFGLSPLDRRRLSWEIERGERAEVATRSRRNKAKVRDADASTATTKDARELLA